MIARLVHESEGSVSLTSVTRVLHAHPFSRAFASGRPPGELPGEHASQHQRAQSQQDVRSRSAPDSPSVAAPTARRQVRWAPTLPSAQLDATLDAAGGVPRLAAPALEARSPASGARHRSSRARRTGP